MFKEFKEFAMRGNVIDLAVGIIIGGAFGKIVSSLVNDLVMPMVGVLVGRVNFTSLKYVIKPAEGDSPELALLYGQFLQNVVDFLIIAFAVFLMVKSINHLKRLSEKEAQPIQEVTTPETTSVPELSTQEQLLTEIRDLLAKK